MKQLFRVLMVAVLLFSYSENIFAEPTNLYAVKGVAEDDYLNVREEANAGSHIVTRIPFDGTGIVKLETEGNWWKVKWEGKQGWVNKRYLFLPSGSAVTTKKESKAALRCGGTEPFWGIKITKKTLEYAPMDGEKLKLPIVFNKTSENNTSIASIYAEKANNKVIAVLQKVEMCSDGMSDIDYPYAISVLINKEHFYSGCCHVK